MEEPRPRQVFAPVQEIEETQVTVLCDISISINIIQSDQFVLTNIMKCIQFPDNGGQRAFQTQKSRGGRKRITLYSNGIIIIIVVLKLVLVFNSLFNYSDTVKQCSYSTTYVWHSISYINYSSQ